MNSICSTKVTGIIQEGAIIKFLVQHDINYKNFETDCLQSEAILVRIIS